MNYIYIMQKRHRGVFALFDFILQNCKIGVSSAPELREEQVDDTTRGEVVLVRKVPVLFGAYAKERFLHKLFAPVRYEAKPARGYRHASGGTEWFHLTIVGRLLLEILLFILAFDYAIIVIFAIYTLL